MNTIPDINDSIKRFKVPRRYCRVRHNTIIGKYGSLDFGDNFITLRFIDFFNRLPRTGDLKRRYLIRSLRKGLRKGSVQLDGLYNFSAQITPAVAGVALRIIGAITSRHARPLTNVEPTAIVDGGQNQMAEVAGNSQVAA
jgi:hypothetical protein